MNAQPSPRGGDTPAAAGRRTPAGYVRPQRRTSYPCLAPGGKGQRPESGKKATDSGPEYGSAVEWPVTDEYDVAVWMTGGEGGEP
jgi:hypothetical protein